MEYLCPKRKCIPERAEKPRTTSAPVQLYFGGSVNKVVSITNCGGWTKLWRLTTNRSEWVGLRGHTAGPWESSGGGRSANLGVGGILSHREMHRLRRHDLPSRRSSVANNSKKSPNLEATTGGKLEIKYHLICHGFYIITKKSFKL